MAIWLGSAAFSLWGQESTPGPAPRPAPAPVPGHLPPEEIEARLEEALRQRPDSFEANFALGGFLIHEHRFADAIPHLQKAHQADPSHYGCGYDLALAYLRTGELGAARDHLSAMIAREDRAELHNLLGVVEERAGNIEIGVKELQKAAEMNPSEPHVFDFGSALLKYQAFEGALKILRYGEAKYPGSARLKVAYGSALYSQNFYDEAVQALCAAVDLDPRDQRALYFLGQMHDVSPKLAEEVTSRLKGFAELYPDNAAANYFYALSLWKQNQPDPPEAVLGKVETLLDSAVANNPRLPEAHYHLGLVYEQRGQTEDAIRAYGRAVEIEPDYTRAYYRLGQAYRRTSRPSEAKEALATYQRLHASDKREQESEKRPVLSVK